MTSPRTSPSGSVNVYKRRFPRCDKNISGEEEDPAGHGRFLTGLEDDQDGEDPAPEELPREEGPCGPGTLSARAGSVLQRAVSGGLRER